MHRAIRVSVWVCALVCLAGCSAVVKRPSAKEYFDTAEKAYQDEDYNIATENFRDLLDQYPLNPYAEESQLKIAYAYYLDEEYSDGIAAFSDFERAYPTSPHLPFVEYYRGMSYLEQMRSPDRDQAVTQNAYEHFQIVLERYPASSFGALAEEKSRECRESLAASILGISAQYRKIGHLFAARVRLRSLVEQYPETEASTDALAELEEVLAREGESELAALAGEAHAFRANTPPSAEQIRQLEHIGSVAEEVALPEDGQEAVPPGAANGNLAGLPEPSLDPLLLLVTELRKDEAKIRAEALEDRRKELQLIEEAREKYVKEAEERRLAGLEEEKPARGIRRFLPWASGPADPQEEEEDYEEEMDPMLRIREWMPEWIPL